MPRPVLPAQDVAPWMDGLRQMLRTREIYEEQRALHQTAAVKFVRGIDRFGLETLLLNLEPTRVNSSLAPASSLNSAHLAHLSEAKRTLLLKRLRERQSAKH
jgi:hypothetical protein